MMASKAIKPVYDVFKEAGIQFDESQFVPTVSGYYSDSKTGHLLSQPFNSSTPVLYYNKDAFKKAGLDPEQPPKTWQDLADYAAKLKASGMKCGYASGWQDGSNWKTLAPGTVCRLPAKTTALTAQTRCLSSTSRSR